ncbi:DUF3140 domain-containing protein [Streptomyces sp. NPDC058295]|uniref:DUF3140 domain-containing protein n=1 Tax=Streptomyces sp. NPDC058295 TaxID=3346431 RepID=UPI0036E543ED
MTAGRLEKWLATEESKSVGQSDGGESVGTPRGGASSSFSTRTRRTSPPLRGATPS